MHKIPAKLKKRVFSPPYNPPRRPAHSAGPAQVDRSERLFFDQNFDHFLTSIFGRFGVVLGRHLGVIFGLFGVQVGPSSVQKTCLESLSSSLSKTFVTHQMICFPKPERFWGPQDGLPNASRLAPDGYKRLLKINGFPLENSLNSVATKEQLKGSS